VMRIQCPHCGPRDELEFTWGGEAHLVRPDPAHATDEQWADYLVMRHNTAGPARERWCHTYGCGQWFNAERDTVTHRIARVYGIEEPE
jgi:sarcosine oxidase subunit delta